MRVLGLPWVGEIYPQILSVDFSHGLGISPFNHIWFLEHPAMRITSLLCWKWMNDRILHPCVKLIHSNKEDHADWGALRKSLWRKFCNELLIISITAKIFYQSDENSNTMYVVELTEWCSIIIINLSPSNVQWLLWSAHRVMFNNLKPFLTFHRLPANISYSEEESIISTLI